ncbi:MAG: arylsulfatase [Lentisphaerae bacterium]|jgi:arylsulfatase|nr:arylsulfatase [Lentisphaerota bacterium]MBT4818343.1 arylsulfatase [Lentisphaerota bacterium]MBT5610706.1 arylsulfatase [Lentisphaerota bacterium]MBT7054275.1 arylsulfatase [Lentisphaerota bacterium]MBT7844336.1 arylsulfatase [Lentisphaerota bacterium]
MAQRPNILLIVTEQHRGDCLGVEGHPVLLTPTMDGIAQRGARLRHFYSACPTCISARRSILAGQLPQTHGLVGYRDGVTWDPESTLAEVLRDGGYQTRWIGRGMHQYPGRKRFGYEEVETTSADGFNDYREWLREAGPQGNGGWFGGGVMHNDWTARPWPLEEHLHQTNWTVARALTFLKRRDPTCPFFLTLSFIAAHPPLQPPAFYLDRYLRTGVPEPVIGDWASPPGPDARRRQDMVAPSRIALEGEALLSTRAAYYGLINHMDDQLRRLLNPIVGLTRNDTIVALTSDHGEMLGDHYCWRKSQAYEPSARVPFLIEGPASLGLTQGTVHDQVATHADIMPTLLDLVGLETPPSVDGVSLAPVLRGETPDWRPYVHIEHAPLHHSLTDGREKYIWFPQDGREQFFDLEQDPEERHDLSAASGHLERVACWRDRLIAELAERPEGFVVDGSLVAGKSYGALLPHGGTPADFKRERFI